MSFLVPSPANGQGVIHLSAPPAGGNPRHLLSYRPNLAAAEISCLHYDFYSILFRQILLKH